VTQQLANRPAIVSFLYQVRGKTMPQGMHLNLSGYPFLLYCVLKGPLLRKAHLLPLPIEGIEGALRSVFHIA